MTADPPALVPEFSVSDWRASCDFYVKGLGFSVAYDRPEDGFAYLRLGRAELMIDQIGSGRDFDGGLRPTARPFGRGVNLQIEAPSIDQMLASLERYDWPLFLPVEERWYRRGSEDLGQTQFVVADPDGYLLRFWQTLGRRPFRFRATASHPA